MGNTSFKYSVFLISEPQILGRGEAFPQKLDGLEA